MEDVIIIGAGPAGLTAAIYALRANKKVLIFEENTYGGKILSASSVENYPAIKQISGFDFAKDLYEQVKSLGGKIIYEKVIGIKNLKTKKQVITNKGKYDSKAIIIATGVQTRKLGLKNENEFLGKGISYCATCDGAFFKGKDVGVVGGGNTAITDALFLSDYCNMVYVIYRGDTLKAEAKVVDRLKKKKNVKFIYNTNVVKINGNELLDGVDIKNSKTNKKTKLNISGLFIAVGQMPSNEDFQDIIKLDNRGYIIGDESCHTNIKGIYVAGDTRTKEIRQLTTAASDGTIAALTAIKEMK